MLMYDRSHKIYAKNVRRSAFISCKDPVSIVCLIFARVTARAICLSRDQITMSISILARNLHRSTVNDMTLLMKECGNV